MARRPTSPNSEPADRGRRNFLLGAAALTTAPLVAGPLAACDDDARPAQSRPVTDRVATATTVTGRRSLAGLQVCRSQAWALDARP
ncbi:hypothetical protein OH799_11630 [Nocardia sp. NBC_00881]|uniref:hypothetical protein n=1 Tax=Nocardia sp. NBC_00881 TaxID=2975995 RepID=UPI00386812EA|nr:hypothetical protein OH799_11630 [Nocardia sp. NBC_00881]